jgi:arginine utilization regulatory protein
MVSEFEKAFLREALKEAGGNISKAADRSGLARQNFQALMKKYGIKKAGA